MDISSLVWARFPVAIQHHYHHYAYLGFSLHKLLRTDITHLHNYEVRGLINSHVCGLGVNCHILIWQYVNYTRPLFLQ